MLFRSSYAKRSRLKLNDPEKVDDDRVIAHLAAELLGRDSQP